MEVLRFIVNGEPRDVEVAADEMLSDVLRNRLGLTGTKVACQEAECGACTVLMDGLPVLSCTLPALKAMGTEVITIEGLAQNGKLHALQEAFIQYGAVQCGFCTPGQIMTAYALLESNPNPTQDELRHALKDTLCRCGSYRAIERAVDAAKQSLQNGTPVAAPALATWGEQRVVGTQVIRPDAVAKVTGEAIFTDDLTFPGMLHARVLRAGIPHAVVRGIDTRQAHALPGVHAVLTADDIPGEINHGVIKRDWPTLVGVGEKVRYVGDALAIVAANTRAIATHAIAQIQVELEELPVVANPVQAHEPDAPLIHQEGNLLDEIRVSKGDVRQGFNEADEIFEQTYHTPTMDHLFMEPECSIARISEDGRMEVYVGSQIPYADRDQIAAVLGLDVEQVRVRGTLIGGGFGGKEDIAGQIHAALLAQATGRPVKLLYDRHESLLAHPKRHATQLHVRLGAKRDGTLLAAETVLYGDTGAYASLGEHVMTRATTHSTGPYIIPHVDAVCYAMHTNNPPSGAFRGFGALQAAFAIESAMDEFAEQLGMDRLAFRRRNALKPGAVTNTGQLLEDSVGLMECIDAVVERTQSLCPGEDLFASRLVEGRPNLRRAWGFAATFKNTGLGGGADDKAGAEVELFPDGRVQVRTSSAEIGQGLVTVLQLITAEELAMPVEQVDVLLSDTDLTPDGGPTTASRQTYVSGNAARHAARALREQMSATLAESYDCSPDDIRYESGHAHLNGERIPYSDIGALMKREGREPRVLYTYHAPETKPLGSGGDMHFAYSFAAQAAEVEVDLLTGEVKVLQVVSATDVGRAINPLGLEGQIEGGIIMGVGHTLTEEYILEQGRPFSDRMARYRIPSPMQAPEIHSIIVESPAADGPYGAKGVGEISTMATPPAITNAIYNACGVRVRKLPVDQDQLALEISRDNH